MAKTYAEINDKIKKGTAVVLTAEEVAELAKTLLPERDRRESGCRDHGHFRGNVFLRGIFKLRTR